MAVTAPYAGYPAPLSDQAKIHFAAIASVAPLPVVAIGVRRHEGQRRRYLPSGQD